MNKDTFLLLSNACAVLGFLSILGSIAIWYMKKGSNEAASAHAEDFFSETAMPFTPVHPGRR